jgi:hypothetical protein
MSADMVQTRRSRAYVDPAPITGDILLVVFDTENLDSIVLRLTPAMAAKLGQRLIAVANRMQL